MNRLDIVGLSLAEIALVLVFGVLAIFAPAYSRLKKELRSTNSVSLPLRDQITSLQQQLRKAQVENSTLREQFVAQRPNLRSKQTPSCMELHKAATWLFTAVVLGADRYEIDGQKYTLQELLTTYSSATSSAKQDGCVQSIKISCGENVSGSQYQTALVQLGQSFYISQSSTLH
jgi:hypothetical protein